VLLCRASAHLLIHFSNSHGLNVVIAGLDPAIHPLRKTLAKMDGCPDQVHGCPV